MCAPSYKFVIILRSSAYSAGNKKGVPQNTQKVAENRLKIPDHQQNPIETKKSIIIFA
jgi:hypothetical protein